jgi:V/A-type H+-transporting ATPase subunit D
MALRDIKPTRSELINLKRKIQLSERGYKILKMKRDGLILEFFKILGNARDSRGELLSRYQHAVEMMALANTVEGAIGVKSAALSVKEVPQISLKSKNIMGVVVPRSSHRKSKRASLTAATVFWVHRLLSMKLRPRSKSLSSLSSRAPRSRLR